MGTELLRLAQIEITGLFGCYTHRIDLNTGDRVTLLHGPNGVGKTTVLQMVNALVDDNLTYLAQVPFATVLLRFMDGSTFEMVANDKKAGARSATVTLQAGTGKPRTTSVALGPTEAEEVAARVEYLRPHASMAKTWIDVRDDEVLTESEVLIRYGGRVVGANRDRARTPKWMHSFLSRASAHFIEAQRLVQAHWNPRLVSDVRMMRRRGPAFVASVVERSRDFQERLGDAMASYGRHAQALDQTFPQRLVTATDELELPEIQSRLTALDTKTENLKAIGILDETPSHPFDAASLRDMDNTQTRVMTLYIDDTESKLAALDDLAGRAQLLLNNVNEKYQHKRIRLDQEKGLVAEGEADQLIPLDALSSGEQHEFVLHYDLLFRVRPNTVVLIDEPELSLHVAWQKKFLPDLLDIVNLSGFDAIVATHSPFIIGERDDLMVGLGGSS